ncbi:DUF7313 family protein [Halobaculum magnesiiphilum]|uniref:DUF7313 domain-containing protein n=1 Tax=Halobaculum magnesiiphilum TaxID=1017351 RepID=A0A8T8WBG3_9EURY|nr:hypothetical protein [Halobaculum magnesiiphilum]QZP37189.1 hypothetical protein K6T50_12975 [Halobaculum magnesiiphilum]
MLPSPLEFLVPLGALESVADVLPFAILAVVLVNVVTRLLAQRSFERAAAEGDDDEALSRFLPHEIVNGLLVLLSFAFMIVEPHGGMVLSVLVVGMVISDFFEYESRRVEARNDLEMDKPNSAIVASALVIAYAGYQALFFLVEPIWSSII